MLWSYQCHECVDRNVSQEVHFLVRGIPPLIVVIQAESLKVHVVLNHALLIEDLDISAPDVPFCQPSGSSLRNRYRCIDA